MEADNRLTSSSQHSPRNDSIETALKLGNGSVIVNKLGASAADRGEDLFFSEHFACIQCELSLGEIAPRTFSFNSPHGACSECTGLGVKLSTAIVDFSGGSLFLALLLTIPLVFLMPTGKTGWG